MERRKISELTLFLVQAGQMVPDCLSACGGGGYGGYGDGPTGSHDIRGGANVQEEEEW